MASIFESTTSSCSHVQHHRTLSYLLPNLHPPLPSLLSPLLSMILRQTCRTTPAIRRQNHISSGKSTLIGVLSSSGLDDGRGAARSLVLRHRHEQENGRTSAVTMEIMGYAKDGQQVRLETRTIVHTAAESSPLVGKASVSYNEETRFVMFLL